MKLDQIWKTERDLVDLFGIKCFNLKMETRFLKENFEKSIIKIKHILKKKA